jgi:FkbM family methyltransferase
MFNNCNSKENGEIQFYSLIKNNINVIFDVGCRQDSEFLDFKNEVHYFEPVPLFMKNLSEQKSNNKKSYFNNFGLSNKNEVIFYYPNYQSFYDRVTSCKVSDDSNKILLNVKKASDYIIENNINTIDFLKIDTEGYELNVLKGFDEYLHNVNIIQFEYGGTFLDSNTKLIDVINYLKMYNFNNFSYLTKFGPILIDDFSDHYQYCNVVCFNKNSKYIPY